jgi:hypothetical protein
MAMQTTLAATVGEKGRGGRALRPTANSTGRDKAVDSRALVPPSSRKASELTIEALYVSRTGQDLGMDEPPDEGVRARLICDITRLLREPGMCETTRTAGLTLIGWLARRMPGEEAHAIGVSEARDSERRLRTTQRKAR